MKRNIAIIGAGVAGLSAARVLQASGARLVVLEKSRGVGGRMATKRVGEAVFDTGAQFFTAREDGFASEVQRWADAGKADRWPGSEHRWIGRGGMTAVPKLLAEGIDVERERKVTAARHHPSGYWELDIENAGILRAERLVLTAPMPQALALLDAGSVRLPDTIAAELRSVSYRPCLAALLVLDGPSAVPQEGVAPSEGPLRWVADNSQKGLCRPTAVTLHATPEFSAREYGRPEAEVLEQMIAAAQAWLGSRTVSSATLHRWRYSEPVGSLPKAFSWVPELSLGFAGDAFLGGRVEAAALSGIALGQHIASQLIAAPVDL
jgi:predicted NAD/FAD-dependent oxidoreductase